MHLDHLITGGTLVNGDGEHRLNVGIKGAQIAYVGPDEVPADSVMDASGLYLLPGGIDTHVHLMDPGSPEREDFPTGTAAAAISGVTTIIEHAHGRPVRTVADLEEKRAYLTGRSSVDYALAAHAWPGGDQDISALWNAGVGFFKVFTCNTHGIPGHNAADLRSHLQKTAACGAISLLHCEDESLTAYAEVLLRESGRTDNALLLEWRNRDAEVVAAVVAGVLVRRTGARAVIAHVSNPEVAAYTLREREMGATLYAESCPQYFLLREDEVHTCGTLRKFTPPARARNNGDEADMWTLLRQGKLTHISSDHAPSTMEQKMAGDMWNVHFGLPGLDSTMSILLDAVARGHLQYSDVARVYSEIPADIYGLSAKKGRIKVGADADMIVVDPNRSRTITNDSVVSKAGWSPFDGREVRGVVTHTFLRGMLIAQDRQLVAALQGDFILGGGA